ncbi:MAG TPA: hypothetical protein VMU89_13810 [Thermomicrobiaceae bacterium]|nr:hypothetical protein [Thermomicrobiaceae bacterium]
MDRVWVVSRTAQDTCLIVGVFSSALSARRYVDRMSDREQLWEAPRPGHQYWTSRVGFYRYLIEEHPVRPSEAFPADLDDPQQHERIPRLDQPR